MTERKFTLSRSPRDFIYMFLFTAFGLWMLFEFMLKANIFGSVSLVSGPFLILGSVCYLFTSPRDFRKLGALIGLVGSGLACFMFFTLQEMISNLMYVYPAIQAILALGVSFLCLSISLAQLCKAL